jgi:uncharacterized membrane protein YebE (DUF533 family)
VEICYRSGSALENDFFSRQDEALLQRMREADRIKSRRAALASSTGISDDAVLDQLLALNLDAQTLIALAMVPVALVAWADGSLDPKERDAIHEAAREVALTRSPDARSLLAAWLAAPPSKTLADAWRSYVQAVSAKMTLDARAALKRETLERARRVAEAAGGFLGLGNRISDAEARVMEMLGEAFDG